VDDGTPPAPPKPAALSPEEQALEDQARRDWEQQQLDALRDFEASNGTTLDKAILRLGGLPFPDSPQAGAFKGELAQLHAEVLAAAREARRTQRGAPSLKAALARVFSPEAENPDRILASLNAVGFEVGSLADVSGLYLEGLRTGRHAVGYEQSEEDVGRMREGEPPSGPALTFASPKVHELRAQKTTWLAAGATEEGARSIVSSHYKEGSFAAIQPGDVLVPIPSTSGRNILPRALAERIAAERGAEIFGGTVAQNTALEESKNKTGFWRKVEDPVRYVADAGLPVLAAYGRPVWIVEDVHNTGESWLAFADLLRGAGIQVRGVAALTASDTRRSSARDVERISEKVAAQTGVSLDDVQPLMQGFFRGTFKQWTNKAEREISGKPAAARRLFDLAARRAEAGGNARAGEPEGRGANEPSREGQRLAGDRVGGAPPVRVVEGPAGLTPGEARQMLIPYGDATGLYGKTLPSEESASAPAPGEILGRLATATAQELQAALTAGKGTVSSILAAAATRQIPNWNINGAQIDTPEDFAKTVQAIRSPHQEMLKVALLNNRGKVVHSQILTVGTINETVATPREMMAALALVAKKTTARRIIISHNHPSGDPSPSEPDRRMTVRMQTLAGELGFEVVDHIITNGESFFSFKGETLGNIAGPLAKWEVIPRSKLSPASTPDEITQVVKLLRQGDQAGARHVIYLNTKLRITAIERIGAEVSPDMFRRMVVAGAIREGAFGLAVDFGRMDARDGTFTALRNTLQTAQIRFLDASTAQHPSFVSAGLMSESPGMTRVREDEATRRELAAEPDFVPLVAIAAKGLGRVPIPIKPLPNFKPTEMPELVELYRDITGMLPELKKFRSALGMFYPGTMQIKLDPRIFADPQTAMQVLAHEFGHLTDYLPQKTLARGNLWGRIHALRNYLKERWTSFGPTNKEMRAELMAITQRLHPFDEATAPEWYVKYRKSASELYAEFVSMMFLSPGLAKELAPKFWREFWQGLKYAKPDVHDAIIGLQALLARPMAEKLTRRAENVRAGFKAGEEIFMRKFEERQQRYKGFGGFVSRMKQGYYDQFSAGRDRAQAAGDHALVELFDAHPMARNEHWRWLERMHRTVVEPLEAAGFSLDDLGEYLFYDRILNESYPLSAAMAGTMGHATGGRSVIANPLGHQPATARLGLLQMRLEAKGRMPALEQAVRKFHDEVLGVMRSAHKAGLLTGEQMAMIEGNAQHYAAFLPLEYADLYVPAGLRAQAGTFKEITNPFLATVLKVLSMQRAIQVQELKAGTVAMMLRDFPGEIALAATRRSADGRTVRPVPPRERGQGQVMVREGGKPAWYNVPQEVALMFEHAPLPLIETGLDILRVPFQKFFYPLFITFNPIFQLVTNPIRDARRSNLNRPAGVGLGAVLRQLPLVRQLGSNPALDAVRALIDRAGQEPIIAEMLDNLAILPGDATFSTTGGIVDSTFDRLLQNHGLVPPDQQSKWLPVHWPVIGGILRSIQRAGRINELLPKVDIYGRLRAQGWSPKDAGVYVRNYIGTPHFGRRGKYIGIVNAVVPFLNIWTKGWGADVTAMSKGIPRLSRPGEKGSSAAAWWIRWAMFSAAPRVLMRAAALGLLGVALKKLYDGIGKHDLKNYDVVPLGYTGASDVNPEGAVAFIRIPKDPTDSVVSGIFDNILEAVSLQAAKAGAFGPEVQRMNQQTPADFGKALTSSFSVAADDVPGMNPLLKIGAGWKSYLSGQNPYDDFRGSPILSDAEHLVRGWEGAGAMLNWTVGQTGVKSFVRYNPASDTTTEIAIDNMPVLNGLVKVTESGYRQKQRDLVRADQAARAADNLGLAKATQALTTDFYFLRALGKYRKPEQEQRYAELRGWHAGIYEPVMDALRSTESQAAKARLRRTLDAASAEFVRKR
jgi:DNA repair protein RadC